MSGQKLNQIEQMLSDLILSVGILRKKDKRIRDGLSKLRSDSSKLIDGLSGLTNGLMK